ncbi:MAG: hypothetical protein WBM44_01760, partial [Waterburya sp.]
MITIGNFNEVIGTRGVDNLTGSDLDALYSVAGNDTLGAVENTEDAILIGGSGDDLYEASNNSTLIVVENGNDDNDVGKATGVGFFKDTSFSLEIDNGRHLYAGDTESNQYYLVVDWQAPENRIETFEAEDGNFSYQDVVDNLRSSPGYQGSFTWEEAIAQEAFDLERLGLSIDTIDEAISQVNSRSAALESREPIGNFRDIVGGEGADNLLGTDLQALYGLEGDDTLRAVEVPLPAGTTTLTISAIGGSGDDTYQLSNNSTAIVIENGNSDNDIGQSTGIGFFSDTSFSLEIDDDRHLFVGDTASNQYALLV